MKENEYMKKIKIVTVITLFLISLNGCKKSKEELEKELDSQKDKLISESINSVYQLGSNGFAFLIDPSNVRSFDSACLDFKPSEGFALVKFYKNAKTYKMQVKTKTLREYIFNYEGKEGIVQLNLWGEFPVREGTMDMLTAKANMIIPSDPKSSGEIGRIDLVYGNESIAKARHGRFKTLEECEAQYAADEELSETLRKQDGACEGPGC